MYKFVATHILVTSIYFDIQPQNRKKHSTKEIQTHGDVLCPDSVHSCTCTLMFNIVSK